MNKRYYALPLSTKLIAIMVTIALLVGIVFATAVLINERSRLDQSTRNEIETLSQIISSNVAAPLLFDDNAAAEEVLRSLSFKPEISQVTIYNNEGQVFAEFKPDDIAIPPDLMGTRDIQNSTVFTQFENHLVGFSAVVFEGDRLGHIKMAMDLRFQQRRKQDYLFLVAMILLGVSILAYFVSTQLQKTISQPINRLSTAMQEVTASHDFALRVNQNRDDEIGALYRGFNDMLRELEVRDKELSEHRQTLESGIKERTRELDQVVRQRIDWLENMANFLRHELKNNIAAFSSSLQLIERKTGGQDLESVLERARRSLRYMGQLLDSVGGATSLQASLYGDQFRRINLSELLHARIDDLIEIYGDQFSRNIVADLFIEGNEERICQLLDKLISNAVEHNQPDKLIEIKLHFDSEFGHIEVLNYGSNLPQNKSRIFDAFVSLRDSDKDGHLGVGLFVVKLIAESHGGNATANDLEQGSGAKFVVSLPLPRA